MRFCGPFTAGILFSVGSLWRMRMMLEDTKFVRTPRTSLIRRSCAIFGYMIATLILNYAETTGNIWDDLWKLSVTAGTTAEHRKDSTQEHRGIALQHVYFVRNNLSYVTTTPKHTSQEILSGGTWYSPLGQILWYRLLISVKGIRKMICDSRKEPTICMALEYT